MKTTHIIGLILAAAALAACKTTEAGLESYPTPQVESGQLNGLAVNEQQAALMPGRPATKSNVIAAEYSANFKYADLANRIDRTFRSCWIGKNAEFAGYNYAGLTQDNAKLIISLTEDVDGQQMDLVKVVVVPAAGQDGYAISLETRAEGSPGEQIMKDGIRHIASGQKVC